MINIKFIFRPDWMCTVPHFHIGKRGMSFCFWFIDFYAVWKE